MMIMEKSKHARSGEVYFIRDIGKGAVLTGVDVRIRVPAPTRVVPEERTTLNANAHISLVGAKREQLPT